MCEGEEAGTQEEEEEGTADESIVGDGGPGKEKTRAGLMGPGPFLGTTIGAGWRSFCRSDSGCRSPESA